MWRLKRRMRVVCVGILGVMWGHRIGGMGNGFRIPAPFLGDCKCAVQERCQVAIVRTVVCSENGFRFFF